MATLTRYGPVFAVQNEMGVFIVVETGVFPITFGMTRLAFLAEAPFVLVVFAMACDAGFGRRFEIGVFMARLAFHLLMLT